ncbi:MAG: bifunctional biotin--[acetyl-CoA-carboxylase] synthetase/biotin operon repressor, partial [Halieaceae bacterium]|nr:bifunctional biotin--[acetyl-CoA-carboxylase] synthetase/biotin operon repressor [Halieaceae bacterium]
MEQLLQTLADGAYHGDADLAVALGVEAADLAAAIHELAARGLPLESDPGRGWRLAGVGSGGLELLDEAIIRSHLRPEILRLLSSIAVYPLIDSTNAELLRRASDLPDGFVCLAEQQSSGRGRRGRPWRSPFGRNL